MRKKERISRLCLALSLLKVRIPAYGYDIRSKVLWSVRPSSSPLTREENGAWPTYLVFCILTQAVYWWLPFLSFFVPFNILNIWFPVSKNKQTNKETNKKTLTIFLLIHAISSTLIIFILGESLSFCFFIFEMTGLGWHLSDLLLNNCLFLSTNFLWFVW